MIYKESKENLLKEGLIKKCPVGWNRKGATSLALSKIWQQ